MTPAERQQRRRDKLKAMCNASPAADPVLAFLTNPPDAVADGIYRRLGPEMARDIAVALKRRLWQNGNRPDWQPSPRATPGAHLGWMAR